MDAAREHYEAALAIFREIGGRRDEGIVLGNLGNLLRELGRMAEAREHYEAAIAINREVGNRREEGIAWLAGLERHWEGKNNFVHHLWWHRAMFHLELRETDAVLELYDKRFRNLASPLVAAMPDLYIDVQNAASMLFRLERQGVVACRELELLQADPLVRGPAHDPSTLTARAVTRTTMTSFSTTRRTTSFDRAARR